MIDSATPRLRSVSVVVPTWIRSAHLARCLDGLRKQTRLPDEVVVVGRDVDASAQDVVRGAVLSIENLRWVGGAGSGHVKPIRRGLQAASGDIVAFLDDDVIPHPDWLANLLRCFADPRVACVGGRVVAPPGFDGIVHGDAGQIRWYGRHVGNVGALDVPEPLEVASVMECNSAWRTDILRALEFDPRLDFDDASMYGLDLCLQAAAAGHRVVYTAAARVDENSAPRDPGLDRSDRAARMFAYNRNYTVIALNRFRGIRRWCFPAWWFLVGERRGYGLATGAVDLFVKGPRVWPQVLQSFRGKFEGVQQWLDRSPSRRQAH